MNTETLTIENLERHKPTFTEKEYNTIIQYRIQALNNMLDKKLISIQDYNHTKSRIKLLVYK